MTRSEFEHRITTRKPTAEEYQVIELVYTHHPSISNAKGKDEIAELYQRFGMRIIRDMEAAAKANRELEKEIATLDAQRQALVEEQTKLKYGIVYPPQPDSQPEA